MIVRIKADQPPRLWHTDPRPVSEDLADEEKHGGAQLNDLVEALARMTSREYGDTPFLRQLNVKRTPALEAGAQRAIATANHVSFPSLKTILKDWILGHLSIATSEKRMECAEVVAFTFQQMGLLPRQPPANAYSPRDFSAQHMKLPLLLGATLDRQVELVWSGQRNE